MEHIDVIAEKAKMRDAESVDAPEPDERLTNERTEIERQLSEIDKQLGKRLSDAMLMRLDDKVSGLTARRNEIDAELAADRVAGDDDEWELNVVSTQQAFADLLILDSTPGVGACEADRQFAKASRALERGDDEAFQEIAYRTATRFPIGAQTDGWWETEGKAFQESDSRRMEKALQLIAAGNSQEDRSEGFRLLREGHHQGVQARRAKYLRESTIDGEQLAALFEQIELEVYIHWEPTGKRYPKWQVAWGRCRAFIGGNHVNLGFEDDSPQNHRKYRNGCSLRRSSAPAESRPRPPAAARRAATT